jgi:hypothetical protein
MCRGTQPSLRGSPESAPSRRAALGERGKIGNRIPPMRVGNTENRQRRPRFELVPHNEKASTVGCRCAGQGSKQTVLSTHHSHTGSVHTTESCVPCHATVAVGWLELAQVNHAPFGAKIIAQVLSGMRGDVQFQHIKPISLAFFSNSGKDSREIG